MTQNLKKKTFLIPFWPLLWNKKKNHFSYHKERRSTKPWIAGSIFSWVKCTVMNDDNKSRGSYLTAKRFFFRLSFYLCLDKSSKKKTIFSLHHDSNKSEIPLKIAANQKQGKKAT